MATTQQLIGDAQRGNSDARDELYRRYALRVLFLVRVRMGPKLRLKEESGDMAQEALLKSLAGLDRFVYASDGAFIGFLAKKVEEVIRDKADYWEAQGRNPNREFPLDFSRSSGGQLPLNGMKVRGGANPRDIVARNEELDRLSRALDALREESPEYWELVVAINLEGRSFAEIAAERGITPDAVKQKSYRAKAALVRIFEGLT
jgi:RNA polymerase sigma factor (sigma-70 family)